MRIFDSHCHLQDSRISSDLGAVIERASRAGVRKILCCGSTEKDWENVSEISSRYEIVIPAFGLHPWYMGEKTDLWLQRLEEMLILNPGSAVGEIGLDHTLEVRNDLEQLKVFSAQLSLAARLDRPVSIHCCRAWGDFLKVLGDIEGGKLWGAVHSYSGPPELVEKLTGYGLYISFSGSITYDKNKRARESLKKVPSERLLVESDSPDIPPSGVNGFNEPSNIVSVVNRIAELREERPDEVAKWTFRNGTECFNT
ncbi:MAG: TatD family hydrolase [Fibrobacter sp.]|nr:TatD family hydrolase [Fibrobacter sp.]